MWSVILGPDNKFISEDVDWTTAEKFVWDVYCKKSVGHRFPYYRVYLVREKEMLEVGHTLFYRGWNAFGSTGFMHVDGFARRRDAITYMLRVQGFQNKER